MRTKARETLFKILFSSQFSGSLDASFKTGMYRAGELNKDDILYCERMLALIEEHKKEISDMIDKKSVVFPGSGIFPADMSILLLAVTEIMYLNDIPDKVSVNEAANIASRYSTENSASFVSGILASVIGDKKDV